MADTLSDLMGRLTTDHLEVDSAGRLLIDHPEVAAGVQQTVPNLRKAVGMASSNNCNCGGGGGGCGCAARD